MILRRRFVRHAAPHALDIPGVCQEPSLQPPGSDNDSDDDDIDSNNTMLSSRLNSETLWNSF